MSIPNKVNLHLLKNRKVVAEVDGLPMADENTYRVIAGEVNATEFRIMTIPSDLSDYTFTIEMTNAEGYGIAETTLTAPDPAETGVIYKFTLPLGMAVRGYASILIRAKKDETIIPFQLLKVKIWETLEGWDTAATESQAPISWVRSHTAASISVTLDDNYTSNGDDSDDHDYQLHFQLKDHNNENLGSPVTVDLPIENLIKSGSYDSTNKKLVFELQKGTDPINVPIGDLVSGLQKETTFIINGDSGAITKTLSDNTDYTYTSDSITSITLTVPATATQGFYAGANFKVSNTPTALTIANGTLYPLKLLKRGTVTNSYSLTAGKTVMLVIMCDGMNVYCNLIEV